MLDHTEEYRRRYARMPDAELKAINRDDLADIARTCYDQEAARRALPSASPPSPHSDKPSDLVSVASFVFPAEAKLARALLESASIPSYLENEHTLAVNWMLTNVMGGLRLLVPAALAEEARQILRSTVSDQDLDAQAEAARKPDDL